MGMPTEWIFGRVGGTLRPFSEDVENAGLISSRVRKMWKE
jgi:hypothetical protein